jgi:hypothetical protein
MFPTDLVEGALSSMSNELYRRRRSFVDLRTMMRLVVVLSLLPTAVLGALPDDARLAPVRAQLDQVLTAAVHDGVPESILSDKLREGLAKNVSPARLAEVLRGYESRLAEAVALAGPSAPSLLKALAEARAAGVEARELGPLLAASGDAGRRTRALDALTDLAQRGFPAAQAARTVASVLRSDPQKVDRIAAAAQSLSERVGRAQALEAIARAAAKGLGPEHAADFTGKFDDRGPERDNTGQRGPGYQHGKGKP